MTLDHYPNHGKPVSNIAMKSETESLQKFYFDTTHSSFRPAEDFVDAFRDKPIGGLKVELLEITVNNPSSLTISITVAGKRRDIPLYRHRTQFVYQNNLFILDTSELKDFTIHFSNSSDSIFDFSIHIRSDIESEDFRLVMYCSIHQSADEAILSFVNNNRSKRNS